MPALREFANFIILNMANLAETYAQLLAEGGRGYEAFPAEQCTASGRRLLRAVIEAYESETASPLCRLFDGYAHEGPRRWAKDIDPPYPLIEVECLGQTLVPVVTNLEASKFLWQILSEVRAIVVQSMEKAPPISASTPTVPVAPPIVPGDGVPKVASPDRAVDRLRIDDTSIQEHNLLRTLIDNMPDYIYAKDTESRFIIGNAATARVMGAKTPDELVGKTDLDFYPEDLAAQYYADEQAIIQSGRSLIDHEEPIVDPDGNKIWISTTKVPLRNSQGKIVGVVGISRDITERRRLEQQIHQSLERRTRQVQTSTEVAQEIAAAPALDDLFWRVVNLVQERFGYSHVNLYMLEENDLVMHESTSDVGNQMKEAGHKIALSAEQSLIARVARSGEPMLVPDVSQGPAWLPHPALPEAGSELVVPIKLGEQVLGVLDVGNDTVGSLDEEDELILLGLCGQIAIVIHNHQTEMDRWQAEQTLLQERTLLRTLIDNVPDLIYVKDTESRFIISNIANARLMGTTPDELVGKTDLDFHPQELAEKYYADEQVLFQSGQPLIGEEEPIVDSEGNKGWLLTTKVPLWDSEGNIIGLVGISRDITARKQMEETLARWATEFETVAQVSTVISTILDTRKLLQTVVDLTKERFGLYHTHIYLLNESRDVLKLAAGAGRIGRQMVAEEWHIPLEREQSLVARAARNQQVVVVNNMREEPGWLPNPLLPDTLSELAAPLMMRDRLLGILDMQASEVNYFTEEDIRIQTTLAAQVAVALQNTYSFEEARKVMAEAEMLAREQIVLNELGQTLTARLNVNQVLDEAYRQASRLIDTTNFYIGLYDQETEEFTFPLVISESQINRETKKFSIDQNIAGYMIRNRTSLLFEDNVRERQEALGIKMVGEEPLSWLGVPLIFGDRVLGVMTVQSYTTPGLYDDHSRELLNAIGGQVAIALHNATLFESVAKAQQEAENRLQETQILQQLAQTLSGTLQVDEVIDAFFQACTTLLKADFAIFSLVDQERQRVKAVAGFNVTDEHIRRANHALDSDDIMADVIRTGQTEIIKGWDPRFDPVNFEAERMDEWGGRIFAPITLRQENVGLIEVGFKKNVEAEIQDTQVRLLNILIDQTAIALESARRYEASQRAARREQTIRQITEKMRAAATLDELVKATAEELGERLSAGHTVVELGIE
jgi:PAS domain S-box-containing protein